MRWSRFILIASWRILGMGDILSLIEKAESKLDKSKSEEFARKAMSSDGFSLEIFAASYGR